MVNLKDKIEAKHGGKIPVLILELVNVVAPKVLNKFSPNIKELAELSGRLIKRYTSEEHFMQLASSVGNSTFSNIETVVKKSTCVMCHKECEELYERYCPDCYDEYTESHAASPSLAMATIKLLQCGYCHERVTSLQELYGPTNDLCLDCHTYFGTDGTEVVIVKKEKEIVDTIIEAETSVEDELKKYGGWAPWTYNPIDKMLT